MLAVVACALVASSSLAAEETPDSLLRDAASLSKYCKAPRPDWSKKKLSSNLDSCSDQVQTFVKAIETSKKDAKVVETASPAIAAATVNKAASALYVGRIYTEGASLEAALGFFRVACSQFEAVSPYVHPSADQTATMKEVVADTEQALQGLHRSCKTVASE